MKKIAALFLILFSLVQIASVINGLISDNAIVFIVDEEKGSKKSDSEKKEIKEKFILPSKSNEFLDKTILAFHLSERNHTNPCLEKETPPPNI
ncbi:MAG: hypothetical protein WBC06_08455 [Chitinophagaceae bacterium]